MATLKSGARATAVAIQPRLAALDADAVHARTVPILQRMDDVAREVAQTDRRLARIQTKFDDPVLRREMADDDEFWAEGRRRQYVLLVAKRDATRELERLSSEAMAVWRQTDDAGRHAALARIAHERSGMELWEVIADMPTIAGIQPWPDVIHWALERAGKLVPF